MITRRLRDALFRRYCKDNEIPSDDARIKQTIANGPAADKLTESKVTLTVPKCTKEDTGEYSLRLRNKYGEAEANVSGSIKDADLRIRALRENERINKKINENFVRFFRRF